jgi:hypothetical protein
MPRVIFSYISVSLQLEMWHLSPSHVVNLHTLSSSIDVCENMATFRNFEVMSDKIQTVDIYTVDCNAQGLLLGLAVMDGPCSDVCRSGVLKPWVARTFDGSHCESQRHEN